MDQDLKVFLEAMESRLQVNTDRKLDAMESRLQTKLDAMESRFDGKLDATEGRLREHTETVETHLLSEFWKWARSADLKLRQHTGSIAAMDERLLAVEERLSELERRRQA